MGARPRHSPIRLRLAPRGVHVVRPGARYAVHREGDASPGAWVSENDPLEAGWTDVFTRAQGRLLLPLLRARRSGRRLSRPTSADGRLISRACKVLQVSASSLAELIGANRSVLSRAMGGKLPARLRDAILAVLEKKEKESEGA